MQTNDINVKGITILGKERKEIYKETLPLIQGGGSERNTKSPGDIENAETKGANG